MRVLVLDILKYFGYIRTTIRTEMIRLIHFMASKDNLVHRLYPALHLLYLPCIQISYCLRATPILLNNEKPRLAIFYRTTDILNISRERTIGDI